MQEAGHSKRCGPIVRIWAMVLTWPAKLVPGGMRETPLGGKAGHAHPEAQTRAKSDDAVALTFAHDSLFPDVPERDFQDL